MNNSRMLIYESNDENISSDREACYEAVASQEEIYLEEMEEELRVILVSDDFDAAAKREFQSTKRARR